MVENRLGKGLQAIFGGTNVEEVMNGTIVETNKTIIEIKLDKIVPNPFQPRKTFNENSLNELAESIREHGVFTPIIIRKNNNIFEIIAGERRWRASKIAGIERIPAMLLDFNDIQMMEISILENIQREDLTPIEEALSFQKLIDDLGYTQEKLGERIGKSRVYITNSLRLLKLPEAIQEKISNKELTPGQVKPLITLTSEKDSVKMMQKIIDENLSARDVEKIIREGKVKSEATKNNSIDYHKVESELSKALDAYVKIKGNKIQIEFLSQPELERIVSLIKK